MTYRRFLLAATATVVVLAALGWIPTRRLGGPAAVPAMLAGCAAALLASALGGQVLARWPPPPPAGAATPALAALAARLVAVVALALAAALAGPWPIRPLLVWTALAHLALLPVDSLYAVRRVREWTDAEERREPKDPGE